ncbi:glycosyltransferase family 2 protein [Companilactobacillus bobalius]|uniref:Dolichyl-phosphate beta-D-mannosyltransferase n=2 Tax=Companilactobacillus bobalius TaxID=2801451 RepID=A0A202FB95_9LACO|nr:glycosyltransferase family 2 protein [Companilactobacillus bobalius]KAE9564093.1 bactoprenol glucosyl transferase [Companilactobacillus bobalius]OVE97720.1 Dolichyl-phosphate beta-D-mannosyltransferase [Companilactobacillus bobalius]GEO59124.1 bactoprenol glucosyl transferase [Companilactobacillus paralimentarius]
MKTISIIVPCFNEQESINIYYDAMTKIKNQTNKFKFEYWFVDDGSKDKTYSILKDLQQDHSDEVHFISFSRNFGKEAALYAGLNEVTGDYVAVMDVDLQDPPEMLPEMFDLLEEKEYDCVGTARMDREGENKIISFFSNGFYKLINKMSQTKIIPGARDYRLMTRQMVEAIKSMTEYNRFSKGIFSWVGFKTKYLPYKNRERVAGNTSWNFWKLFKYAITGIVDFSEGPLMFATWMGTIFSITSILAIIAIIIRKIVNPLSSVNGWASIVSIVLLIGGIQLLSIGILGEYIGKIFLEVKKRPIYIVKDKK